MQGDMGGVTGGLIKVQSQQQERAGPHHSQTLCMLNTFVPSSPPPPQTILCFVTWLESVAQRWLLPWVPVATAPPMVWYTNLGRRGWGEGGRTGQAVSERTSA
jgi:hypothetical protein